MDSNGNQNISGYEFYQNGNETTEVVTTHQDGVTRQEVTRTNTDTGEVTTEVSVEDNNSTEGGSGESAGGEGSDSDTGDSTGDTSDSTGDTSDSTGGTSDSAANTSDTDDSETDKPKTAEADATANPDDDTTTGATAGAQRTAAIAAGQALGRKPNIFAPQGSGTVGDPGREGSGTGRGVSARGPLPADSGVSPYILHDTVSVAGTMTITKANPKNTLIDPGRGDLAGPGPAGPGPGTNSTGMSGAGPF